MRLTDRAIVLNPNLAWAWLFSGLVRIWRGEPEAAIERLGRALRLNPNDPHSYSVYLNMAEAHLFVGRYDEAVSWAQRAVEEKPEFPFASIVAAACYALAGRTAEGEKAIRVLQQLDPKLRVSNFNKRFPDRPTQYVSKIAEGLRLAGLPE
jgi:tetratricopeptide (TPR) repeat protein